MFDLTGKCALVTGASGGIGAALAAALDARGDDVTGLSRSADGFDMTDPQSVSTHMAALEGPFDTILIASGILSAKDSRPEKSLAEIDAMFDEMWAAHGDRLAQYS